MWPTKRVFTTYSQGSLEECRYYLILIRDLGYADTTQLSQDLDRISRMLDAYTRAVLQNSR